MHYFFDIFYLLLQFDIMLVSQSVIKASYVILFIIINTNDTEDIKLDPFWALFPRVCLKSSVDEIMMELQGVHLPPPLLKKFKTERKNTNGQKIPRNF